MEKKNLARLGNRPLGMELCEITPVIVGGDPVDSSNKVWLTRQQHFEVVRFWNKKIYQLRKER